MEYRKIENTQENFSSDVLVLDVGLVSDSIIQIEGQAQVRYLFLPEHDGIYTRTFLLSGNCQFLGSGIFFRTNIESKMIVKVDGTGIQANFSLLALARSHAELSISGVGQVSPGSQDIHLRVDQTNILLGESAKVRGMPVLEVATDSIEGGHSCRVHRIAGEALFYLQSHGIDAKTAEGMLLESEIRRHVEVMTPESEPFVQSILQTLLIP